MKKDLYIAWTHNCRGKQDHQLYVMHAWIEGETGTVCGARIQEIGERADEAEIDCSNCKRCLRSRGLME